MWRDKKIYGIVTENGTIKYLHNQHCWPYTVNTAEPTITNGPLSAARAGTECVKSAIKCASQEQFAVVVIVTQ